MSVTYIGGVIVARVEAGDDTVVDASPLQYVTSMFCGAVEEVHHC